MKQWQEPSKPVLKQWEEPSKPVLNRWEDQPHREPTQENNSSIKLNFRTYSEEDSSSSSSSSSYSSPNDSSSVMDEILNNDSVNELVTIDQIYKDYSEAFNIYGLEDKVKEVKALLKTIYYYSLSVGFVNSDYSYSDVNNYSEFANILFSALNHLIVLDSIKGISRVEISTSYGQLTKQINEVNYWKSTIHGSNFLEGISKKKEEVFFK